MALRTPLGITLQAMALLRKGVDKDLLGKLMKIDSRQAEQFLRQAALLTLVKERPGKNKRRYFLHDEVYDLYSTRAQQDLDAWKKQFECIKKYYIDEFSDIQEKMETDPKELHQYQVQSRMTKVEGMHYALWFYPRQGFAEYFNQSIEAIAGRVQDWNSLLEGEWERTSNILRREERYPADLQEYMDWEAEVKQVDQASTWRLAIDQKMLDILQKVDDAPLVCQIYIWLVRALLPLRGQPQVPGDTFPTCIDKARELFDANKDVNPEIEPAMKVLEAYLSNYEGLNKRKKGNYKKALAAYHNAGVTMRKLKLGGLSNVLINQAYAMSMLGYNRRATETALEAYTLARKFGSPYNQIRALNVHSLVETSAGYPQNGEVHAVEAIDILDSDPEPRLEALVYISLARVSRYQWNHVFQSQIADILEEGRNLLPKALAYLEGEEAVRDNIKWYKGKLPKVLKGAIEILAETTDKENWVTALNESGCLWRETSWLAMRKLSNEARQTVSKKAQKCLEQAAGVFNVANANWKEGVQKRVDEIGGSYYWPLLAMVNLGWHYHYQNKYPYENTELSIKVNEISDFVENLIDPKYLLQYRHEHDDDWGGDDILLWAVLGKMEMLRGYEVLRSWRRNSQAIENALRHIYLAMEYNFQIGRMTYNNRRAEMGLETRIGRSKNWEIELLPKFFKAEKLVRVKMEEAHLISKPHVLDWLEERFGPADSWIDI